MRTITEYSDLLNQAKGQKALLEKQQQSARTLLEQAQNRSDAIDIAQTIIQQVARDTQEKLRYHIQDIVQLALDACFPDQYEFQVNFEIKRGRTEASLTLLKDGNPMNPMNANGGGIVDITSFALRLAAWSLSKTDNVIIMDEPFRFLSRDLHPRAGEILKELSKKLGLQIIMVTHSEELIQQSDKIFVNKIGKDGVSKINGGGE